MSISADKTIAITYDKIKSSQATTKRKSTDGSCALGVVANSSDNSISPDGGNNRCRGQYEFSVSPTTDYYIQQLKYNEVTRYQPNNALYLWQRRRANKSVPNIIQALSRCDQMTQEYSDQLFGERIFSVNKSNAFTTNRPHDNGGTLIRNAVTPNHEIHQFTRFATKSAARESIAKKMCRHGTACSGTGNNKCMPNNDGQLNNSGDSSRFTITTLARKHSLPNNADDNRTMTRNPGVLIAVRDWMKTGVVESVSNNSSSVDYYERLRTTDEDRPIGTSTTNNDDCDSGPIYAMVNKMNKAKQQQQNNREQTKFTYIGISPTGNSKAANTEIDAIGKHSQPDNNHSSTVALANAINMSSVNNNGIPVNECVTMATTVNPDFSTKIWKGAKKMQNDSQKM